MSKTDLSRLIDQLLDLPEEDQAELVDALLDARAQLCGIYQLDDDDRESLSRSAEDMRLGRFAAEAEVEETFQRYALGS